MRAWALPASVAAHAVVGWFLVSRPVGLPAPPPPAADLLLEVVMLDPVPGEAQAVQPASGGDGAEVKRELATPERKQRPTTPRPQALPSTDLVPELKPLSRVAMGDPQGARLPEGRGMPSAASAARGAWSPEADEAANLLPRRPGEGSGQGEGKGGGTGTDLGEADSEGTHHLRRKGFKAHTQADGRVVFEDDSTRFFSEGSILVFDVNDWLMRTFTDDDPYQYEKAKFLDATREERQAMQLGWRKERLAEAVERLPGWLDKIWKDQRQSPVDRRRLIFQLWDECVETGPADLVRTAHTVREIIERYVRERLPAGSAEAYGDAELRDLNAARSSRAEFQPYQSR